ncbi:MAG TPA: flagellin [Fibrobacteres bacterium]|jgi:flagellin|nr:flagellin [Fibrobacterota bacterium]
MRINHNISSQTAQGSLNQTSKSISKSLEKLSTGLRINSASDDPAGLGISENLRTQINGVSQAQKNAQDGISALNIAEGATNEISSILQRMLELSIQSANDTLTSTERGYTNSEFTSLRSEIDRISAATTYNGMDLISSGANRFGTVNATSGNVLWIDANSSVGVDSITISINTVTSASISSASFATRTISSQAGAKAAISEVDLAICSINTIRANIGAYVNRLEHAVNNLNVSETNQTAAESLIRDVDFAEETSKFTKNQILLKSATAMLAQSNLLPKSILTLMKK